MAACIEADIDFFFFERVIGLLRVCDQNWMGELEKNQMKQNSLPDQWQDLGTCHLAAVPSSWLRMARAQLGVGLPTAHSALSRPLASTASRALSSLPGVPSAPREALLLLPSLHNLSITRASFSGGRSSHQAENRCLIIKRIHHHLDIFTILRPPRTGEANSGLPGAPILGV